MKLKILFNLALRSLWSHKLRTILTISGVTIGIGAIIFLVSLGYGLERLVTSQVANFNAFTIIDVPAANIKTVKVNQETINRIIKIAHVKEIAPVSNLPGRIKRIDQSSTTETVVVAARESYWKLSDITVESGSLPKNREEIVVNRSVLSLIEEKPENIIGKKLSLELVIPSGLFPNDQGQNPQPSELTVVGYTKDDKAPIILTDLTLLEQAGATDFSSVKVKTDTNDKRTIETIRKQIENIGFSTEYVGDTVDEISQVFSLFRAILAAFGAIALVVAALGTFNTLTISLLERIKEVGLLKTLGMKNKDIYKLFIAESLIIGVSGGVLGLAGGWLLGQGINCILRALAQQSGTDEISIFVTPWVFAFVVALFSIILGFLTGWYPSRRAVKINPLDALRYE